jgi:aspartyl/asparaginyl beta-hydroxylase (cupin superfamily)
MLIPFVRHFEFFERADFPWLDAIEASFPAIREELLALLAEDEAGVEPYVQYGEGVPLAQWRELNQSRRWGAYFLWKEGQRLDDHIARAPRTAAALASAPQIDVPGFSPTAFFSILEPNTRIPPHHGVTNARSIVHLPLIIPAGCGFRVGGDSREWRPGAAWVFDDTIEHEAWNGSNERRAILIFDIWNPELTVGERELVRESTRVLADYYRAEGIPDFML